MGFGRTALAVPVPARSLEDNQRVEFVSSRQRVEFVSTRGPRGPQADEVRPV